MLKKLKLNLAEFCTYAKRRMQCTQVLIDGVLVSKVENKIKELKKLSKKIRPTVLSASDVSREIAYIVKVRFSAVNTFLHISDCEGRLEFQTSAGHFFYGKQKAVRRSSVLQKLFDRAMAEFPLVKEKPVALHLCNVNMRFWVVRKLKKKLYVRVVKVFKVYPHNGCRKKKLKRKKFKKKISNEGMAERFMAADCKSVEFSHRRFKSCFLHSKILDSGFSRTPCCPDTRQPRFLYTIKSAVTQKRQWGALCY